MAKQTKPHWLQVNVIRTARVHFYYALALAITIIIYDAGKLITPKAVLQRWTVAAGLLVVTTLVWYCARFPAKRDQYYRSLVYALVLLDICIAAFSVYAERGMASRGVALFAIPLVVSATLLSSRALFATAALSVAAYSFAAVKYFVDFFNEGYKLELYSVIAFYSATFFILAGLLSVLVRNNQKQ